MTDVPQDAPESMLNNHTEFIIFHDYFNTLSLKIALALRVKMLVRCRPVKAVPIRASVRLDCQGPPIQVRNKKINNKLFLLKNRRNLYLS